MVKKRAVFTTFASPSQEYGGLMPSRSKQKGNRFEREIVNIAKENNLISERAYGSDGRALGESKEVDVVVDTEQKRWKIQAKVRKRIASWLKPDSNSVDLQVVKEDRGEIYAILPYKDFIELIASKNCCGVTLEESEASADEREEDEMLFYRERMENIESELGRLK
jgi:hypothetical protein|tara:strand:- start:301 stop:798 length:498 start_codon:yes stop_codon:yes gene_type:complete